MAALVRSRLRQRVYPASIVERGRIMFSHAFDCQLAGNGVRKKQDSLPSCVTSSGGIAQSSTGKQDFIILHSDCNSGGGMNQPVNGSSQSWKQNTCQPYRGYHSTQSPVFRLKVLTRPGGQLRHEHSMSNKWLSARLVADRKRRQSKQKRLQAKYGSGTQDDGSVFTPVKNLPASPSLSQPLPSQPLTGSLKPTSVEEEKLATVLARPDLLITRNIEWANLAFGFEQENRYVMIDPRQPHAPVGYILEESVWFTRQLLRTRRPFVASILDGNGVEIFRVRRPIWFINSAIYVEVNGKVMGEAHRRWHLWRRIYDLYLGKKQFATVENPGFWYWTFTLKDKESGVLAEIDRNWRGFGYEFFTDAGQYVIRFGDVTHSVEEAQMYTHLTPGQHILPTPRGQPGVVMEAEGSQTEPLTVVRPLNLLERAVTLALAVSLDSDYFSRHSGSFGGFHLPFFASSEIASDGVGNEQPRMHAESTGSHSDTPARDTFETMNSGSQLDFSESHGTGPLVDHSELPVHDGPLQEDADDALSDFFSDDGPRLD